MIKYIYIFIIGILIIGATIGWFLLSNKQSSVGSNANLTYSVILKQVNDHNAAILDVRSLAEYKESHASGAVSFDIEKLKIGQLPDYNKSLPIYVYCRSGNRSSQAYKILNDNGYTNVTDLGGIKNIKDIGATFL